MAASVIDAFVATLGLDGTLFKKGMKDAEDAQDGLDKKVKKVNKDIDKTERDVAVARKKRQKEQDDATKKTADGHKKVRTELLGIAAIFTAGVGLKSFISNTVNGAANLGYLSANLRMSTQDLTSWQRASERAGGSSDGIIAQLKESADTLAQLKSGFGPNEGLQNFFRFGGSSDDLKDGNTYLLARSKIVADLFKQDPAKAALVAKQMGISEDQFNFLKQGPGAVMDLVRAQEKNAAISAKDAQAALELRNRVLDLRDSLQATATRVLLQLAPSLEKLFAKLEQGSQWVAAHKDDISRWIDKCIVSVAQFARVADDAAKSVGGWQNVLMALAGLRVAGIVAGFAGIATAIGGIVAAGAGIPALLLGLAGLGAYAGWKGAEFLFGKKKGDADDPEGDELRKKHEAIMRGDSKGVIPMLSKEQMRADAAGRPRVDVPKGTGSNNDIVKKLTGMGWTPEQAAGIAGSFMQESGLDPTARNPQSGAYGIAQWLGSRVGDFKAFAGRDLQGSSLDQQLEFFNYEVTQGKEKSAGRRLRATTTAEDAARVHSEAYERPGRDEANIARRQRLAAQFASTDRAANANAAGNVPAMAAAGSLSVLPPDMTNSKTDIRIDNITVNTQATDAQGIATSIKPAIEKYTFATQANTGMR